MHGFVTLEISHARETAVNSLKTGESKKGESER